MNAEHRDSPWQHSDKRLTLAVPAQGPILPCSQHRLPPGLYGGYLMIIGITEIVKDGWFCLDVGCTGWAVADRGPFLGCRVVVLDTVHIGLDLSLQCAYNGGVPSNP